jgi:Tol biopolymer transport system component
MNCEQVEELLSAYLDNMLTHEERRLVALHLQSCDACSAILSDYSKNDTLIALLPRAGPDSALRERLFSSPELDEALNSDPFSGEDSLEWTPPPITRLPSRHPRRDTPGRPHLVAIPGGRSTQPTPAVHPTQQSTLPHQQAARTARKRRSTRGLRVLIASLAAALILALGITGFAGYMLLSRWHGQAAGTTGYPTPAGISGGGPLSAGVRYVFLSDGTLWSELADGSEQQPDRLTPTSVVVAPGWAVSPALPGRSAGDRLAYIDLQTAQVHTIRSDGQLDTTIKQPLLKAGTVPTSAWDTATGAAILGSLAWSSDGSSLAFLADPTGTGRTSLYIYSTITGKVTAVPLPIQGSVSHAAWSPDGTRLAFEVSQNGLTSIIDYNVQNRGILIIAQNIGTAGTGQSAGDGVLAMDWSPNQQEPAITWSVGITGHVHSLWMHRVGTNINTGASLLLSGDYAQAVYSRSGDNGVGSWLVITSAAGQASDLWRIDVTPGARFVQLTTGRQVNYAQWSPNGSAIVYLDSLSAGVGTLYVVNASTAINHLIANGVTSQPAPVWSADSQQLAFSTGTRVGIADLQSHIRYLPLKGAASVLLWSITSTHQLIVVMNDGQQGIFLEDIQHNTSQQLDKRGTNGPLLWTQIP